MITPGKKAFQDFSFDFKDDDEDEESEDDKPVVVSYSAIKNCRSVGWIAMMPTYIFI